MKILKNQKTQNKYISVWIFGKPMTGKSTLAHKFPKPLTINTDGNFNQFNDDYIYLNIHKEESIHPWLQLKQFFKNKNNLNDYETIVIDLLEDVYEIARNYVLKSLKIKTESDIAYGGAWKLVSDEFLDFVTLLKSYDKNLVLISHQKIIPVKTFDGEIKNTIFGTPLREVIQNKVAGMVSMIVRTDFAKIVDNGKLVNRYVVYLKESESLANSRIDITKDRIMNNYSEMEKIWKKTF